MNTFHSYWLQTLGLASFWVSAALVTPSAIAQTTTVPAPNSAIDAATPVVPVSQMAQDLKAPSPALAQVTSVSQLSDVKPTDWAFQALQSLVERYGCIVGYPDRTYRGNRATSRYEFAAGLNACLDKIQELIAAATADFVRKEDLETVKRLQEEFAAELAAIRGRVESLEVRTATLEKQQFSTTTRLSGQAIFSLASGYGAYRGGNPFLIGNTNQFFGGRTLPGPLPTAGRDAEVVFNNRVRLNLLTSFSGKDLLITGLQAYNFGARSLASGLGSGDSIASTLGYGDVLFGSASNARLAFEPQFPTVNPQNLSASGGNNSVQLYKLLYIFPVANRITAFAGTSAEVSDAFPSILPWADEGQGAVSRFASLPASHRISGGTSQTGLASAAGVILNIAPGIDLRALYGSVNAAIPNNQGFPGTPLGAGIFGGSYVAAAQLTLSPSKNFDVGLNYAHSYHQVNILGTGLGTADIGSVLFVPDAARITRAGSILGAIANQGITLNTFGATVAFRPSSKFTIAGSATYITSSLVNVGAGTDFLSWLAGIQVNDVVTKGGSAGVVFGSPLYRVGTRGRAFDPGTAVPYQLEGFLNLRLNDNISVTPGVFVIFNAESFSENRTVYVPVLRTTFTF